MFSLLVPLLVLVLVLLLVAVATTATFPVGAVATGPGRATRFFLVLLRLSIGWHFLFEAAEKFNNVAWSSEGYLREASGPLAPEFHDLAGDRLRDRLAVGTDGSFPELLGKEWQAYRERFAAWYELTPEQDQQTWIKLEQAMSRTRTWLTTETLMVKLPSPVTLMIKLPSPVPPPVVVPRSVKERVKLYQDALARAADILARDERLGGKDPQLEARAERTEANRIRTELRKDLDKQSHAMIADLRTVLTPAQTAKDTRDVVGPPPVIRPPFPDWELLDWSDFLVKWGLLVVGVCLIAGLLTRSACVGGALFLLSFFLAMPPLPGLPESPKAEGHYVYLNKNIIEMLALLALATTRSGRWFGLDALLQFLDPRRWRQPLPAAAPAREFVAASDATVVLPPATISTVAPAESPASSAEITHGS